MITVIIIQSFSLVTKLPSKKDGHICQECDDLAWKTLNDIYSTCTVTRMRKSHTYTLLCQVWYVFTLFQLQACLKEKY